MASKNLLWVCSTLLVLVLLPGVTRAEDADEQARARYERAVRLYDEGIYDAALVELNRAYELRPSYKLLYNIAQVRLAMKDYAAALETYQRYLREGGDRIPESRRTVVRDEVERLEQRVARLAITTDVSGAEVFVDDALVGTTPLGAPVLVNSGVRRVVVRHPEHPPQSRRVSIAGGEQQDVALPLAVNVAGAASAAPPASVQPVPTVETSLPPPIVAPVPASPRARPQTGDDGGDTRRSRRLQRALLWSGTAALAATAAGLGIAAMQSERDLHDARDRPGADPSDLQEKSDRVRRLGVATDALIAATVVGAGVSLWLTLRSRGERDRTTAQLGLGVDGVRLRTEF